MWKPASRDNPAARELKITRARNIDRVKAMREYSRSGLLILERILIFNEEGVLSMMPPKAAQYPTEDKI